MAAPRSAAAGRASKDAAGAGASRASAPPRRRMRRAREPARRLQSSLPQMAPIASTASSAAPVSRCAVQGLLAIVFGRAATVAWTSNGWRREGRTEGPAGGARDAFVSKVSMVVGLGVCCATQVVGRCNLEQVSEVLKKRESASAITAFVYSFLETWSFRPPVNDSTQE